MKIKVKSLHHDPLKLIDFGLVFRPGETKEMEVNEKQKEGLEANPSFEILGNTPVPSGEKKEGKKEKKKRY